MSKIIYKELSYQIVGCFFNVRNKYGNHHRENIYHRALEEELAINKINFVSKPRIKLYSVTTGKIIGYYEPDILIDNKIVIEIKALPFTKTENFRQLGEYLKISNYEVGYLVNFGEKNFKPKRYIYTNDRKNFFKLKNDS